ncbi:hypothetical protein H2202_008161 [Exophiala xenobiotica]|nr:hypothetical protein H2202_008161 [Exophiala xenobiotica]
MATFAPRYTYGELRLSRINLLYRFLPELKLKYLFRGYHYGSQTYQRFLESNFAWLIAGFAYIALVLTAVQVGLGTRQLQGSAAFNAASAGFTVFSIVIDISAPATDGAEAQTLKNVTSDPESIDWLQIRYVTIEPEYTEGKTGTS